LRHLVLEKVRQRRGVVHETKGAKILSAGQLPPVARRITRRSASRGLQGY
jgi:hypothetical protein